MNRHQKEHQEKWEKVLYKAGNTLPVALMHLTGILGVIGAELPDDKRDEFAEEWKEMLEKIRQVHHEVQHPSRRAVPPPPKDPFGKINKSIPEDFPTPRAVDWLSEQLKEMAAGIRERRQGSA